MVRQAQITELENRLGRYLDLVRRGETVRVLDRDVPIADIVPIGRSPADGRRCDAALVDLERKGLVRRGSGRIARKLLRVPPRGEPAGVVEALLEERRGR